MDCVFCRIVAGTAEASVVYTDDRLLAFCDLNAVNPGHLLVIPKVHDVGLADLAESDGSRRLFPCYVGDGFRLNSWQRRAPRRDLDEIAARIRAQL